MKNPKKITSNLRNSLQNAATLLGEMDSYSELSDRELDINKWVADKLLKHETEVLKLLIQLVIMS